jgi:flagellar basal body P-ring formation protein FlgA
MKRTLFVIVFLLGLPGWSSALEIAFKPSGQVDDAVIKLVDVAECNEQTPLAEALASQAVGQAPAPGESLVLRAQDIKQYLASSQTLPNNITWSGSSTITISRTGTVVGPERVQALIAEFISSNSHNLPKADITFVASALPLPFTLPKGDLSYEVIPSNPSILGSSRFSLIFKVDNRVVKNMSVRGKTEALALVAVAAQPLKKGFVLGPQHLKMAALDISDLANPAFDAKDLLGMQLTRGVQTDTPILATMVESLPVVKRGQQVKIAIKSGTLQLTATGLAYNDGKLDQMIKVQNISSSKIILGRVAGPGLVEVML